MDHALRKHSRALRLNATCKENTLNMRRLQLLCAILAATLAGSAFAAPTFEAGPTLTFTGTIQLPSCTVDSSTANQTVSLGSVPISSLTSVGTTANPTSFNVAVTNCSPGTNVTMTVTGTAATVASVLTSTGTAAQIGVQLLQAGSAGATTGTPIKLNSAISLGAVDSSNSMTVPFVAQFYQLGTVTPGTVAATATVNFTYN
jgi:major type 1 subunit fimbrin (pilin)